MAAGTGKSETILFTPLPTDASATSMAAIRNLLVNRFYAAMLPFKQYEGHLNEGWHLCVVTKQMDFKSGIIKANTITLAKLRGPKFDDMWLDEKREFVMGVRSACYVLINFESGPDERSIHECVTSDADGVVFLD